MARVEVAGIAFVMRLLTVALGCCLLVLTACSDDPALEDTTEREESGEIVEAGQTGMLRLRLGDCVVLPEDVVTGAEEYQPGEDPDVLLSSMEAVPCSEPHDGEVVLRDPSAFDDLDAFPGEDELFELAGSPSASGVANTEGLCIDALNAYTGTDYESSPYDFVASVPSEQTWKAMDDRALMCIGTTLDLSSFKVLSTTGSIARD